MRVDARHAQATLPRGKRTETQRAGGWAGSRAGLDGCGKCQMREKDMWLVI